MNNITLTIHCRNDDGSSITKIITIDPSEWTSSNYSYTDQIEKTVDQVIRLMKDE